MRPDITLLLSVRPVDPATTPQFVNAIDTIDETVSVDAITGAKSNV
jgi:hypothetical protein